MSQNVATCFGWGLGISSAIAVPGAMAAPEGHKADIDIAYGPAPQWQDRIAWGPYRVADADLFDFDMPDLARFTCRGRNTVVVTPAAGAREEDIAAMLIATVLPALLWARGEIMLHAAAAAPSGHDAAILVAGPSGSGKSTWLARAIDRGATQVADDCVCLRWDGDTVMASGLPGGVWAALDEANEARDFVETAGPRQSAGMPVARIVTVEPEATRRRRLRGAEALAALLKHRHRPRIAALLGTEAGFINPLARIAEIVRIDALPFQNHAWRARLNQYERNAGDKKI